MIPLTPTHTWHRVTRSEPCIVCGKPDYCGRSADGLVRCMRSAEAPIGMRYIRTATDGGHLFAVDDPRQAPPPPPPKRPKPSVDWSAVHAQARAEIIPGELYDFADVELGLSGEAMDLLDVGVHRDRYVCPERDATGNIIGLVKRHLDGRKESLLGSRRGLTYQHPFPDDDPVLVVEGWSDTAAAIEAGFTAVGRPSNTGGGELLVQLLKNRNVIVFGENDEKPNGSWPGRDGAEHIASKLKATCASVRVIYPPTSVKDLRGWLRGEA